LSTSKDKGVLNKGQIPNGQRLALKIKLLDTQKADHQLVASKSKRRRNENDDTDGSWEATRFGKPKRKIKHKKKRTRRRQPFTVGPVSDIDDSDIDDSDDDKLVVLSDYEDEPSDLDAIETEISDATSIVSDTSTHENDVNNVESAMDTAESSVNEGDSQSDVDTLSNNNTIVPYQRKDSEDDSHTDGTLSNDDAIVPYESKDSEDDMNTDGTLSNDDAIVPYETKDSEDESYTDGTLSNDDAIVPYQPESESDEEGLPGLENIENPEKSMKGSNQTLPDGSLVPFANLTVQENVKMMNDIYDENRPRILTGKYKCQFCKEKLETKLELLNHEKLEHPYNCKMCMTEYDTKEERTDHFEVDHPTCQVCGEQFFNKKRYLHHYHTKHSKEEDNEPEPDTKMETESEDEISDEENPQAELFREDKQFHKHINCITIKRFLDIRNLIRNNQFESLVSDKELMDGLQILLKGVVKGFIPICSSQRFALTKQMKDIMYGFVKRPSKRKILKNKGNFKLLIDIVWSSVESVINSFLSYPI